MNEIERVISYIRSCRKANIDVTITINKSRSHLILNALEKQVAKQPTNINKTNKITFNGINGIRGYLKIGECPCCKAYIYTDHDQIVCNKCGQRLDW